MSKVGPNLGPPFILVSIIVVIFKNLGTRKPVGVCCNVPVAAPAQCNRCLILA